MDLPRDLPRESTQFLLNASKTFPVLLLTGVQEIGKTTLLNAFVERGELKRNSEKTHVKGSTPLPNY